MRIQEEPVTANKNVDKHRANFPTASGSRGAGNLAFPYYI